ncbi:hypothetical protein AX14_001715 [Amanita brunnescens Koide BX004]|nr:hypothetical protein AX14_001715 [Amanita brunnescens Koide BX004]
MDPAQLVQQFKKSGEFDRLRRLLLSQFQLSDGITTFHSKVEDIARQRLASDDKLQQLPPDIVHKELMQELDRYPIVERTAAEICTLSNASFAVEVRSSVQRILQASMPGSTTIGDAQAPPATDDIDASQKPDASTAEQKP